MGGVPSFIASCVLTKALDNLILGGKSQCLSTTTKKMNMKTLNVILESSKKNRLQSVSDQMALKKIQ